MAHRAGPYEKLIDLLQSARQYYLHLFMPAHRY